MNPFFGRKLVIATKHKKESVIAPLAASKLGVLPFVLKDFDTDKFGTFSGEIKRKKDPISIARIKCEKAMKLSNCDLAIASEGSFGRHPHLVFIPGNEEIIVLIDKKNKLEIIGKILSTETNFDGKTCTTWEELMKFAQNVHFPTHALILRNAKDSTKFIKKGINHWDDLKSEYEFIQNKYGQVFAETDMRAMFNPTRMKVIAEATERMLAQAITNCEKCESPGFGIIDVITGLPCEACGTPTQSIKAYLKSCRKCGFKKVEPNSEKSREIAMNCDICNP